MVSRSDVVRSAGAAAPPVRSRRRQRPRRRSRGTSPATTGARRHRSASDTPCTARVWSRAARDVPPASARRSGAGPSRRHRLLQVCRNRQPPANALPQLQTHVSAPCSDAAKYAGHITGGRSKPREPGSTDPSLGDRKPRRPVAGLYRCGGRAASRSPGPDHAVYCICSRYSMAARISPASHAVQSSLAGNPDTPALRPMATSLIARPCNPRSSHQARNRRVRATEGSSFMRRPAALKAAFAGGRAMPAEEPLLLVHLRVGFTGSRPASVAD